MNELRSFVSEWASASAPSLPPLTNKHSVASWLKGDAEKNIVGATVEQWDSLLNALCEGCTDEKVRDQFIADLAESWQFWGRPDQFPPSDGPLDPNGPHRRPEGFEGPWRTWMILSGRGAGKTRTGAEWVHSIAYETPGARIALIGETAADTRDVMVNGISGIMACAKEGFRPVYNPSNRSLKWPNGSSALTFSGDAPDQLRGPQFNAAWVDELAKMRYAKLMWDNLQMGLRLGKMPRCLITTTPRPIPLLKQIMARDSTVTTRVSTHANAANLPASFFEAIEEQYAGTRIAAQELHGEIVEDLAGALWSFETIANNRLKAGELTPDLDMITVGVDPSGSKEGDEVGIVAAGRSGNKAYVLGDWSLQASPSVWARTAINAYDTLGADLIVVEDNYGGEMCEQTLRSEALQMHQRGERSSPDIAVRSITASGKGNKVARAMPLAQAYEQGRVRHVGEFLKLEAEMRSFTVEWSRNKDASPNRVDALVYAARYCLDSLPSSRSLVFGVV